MRHAMIVLALLIGGCASFQGLPVNQNDKLVVPEISTVSHDERQEPLRIRITNDDTLMGYCDQQAEGVVCSFTLDFLMAEARNSMSDWEQLTWSTARRICYNGMFNIVRFNDETGQWERATEGLIRACADELLYLRFTSLTPDKINPDEAK